MDEICQLISEKIYAATHGSYGVFYEDELLDIIPEDERSRETLEAALKKLVKAGCIDVKYAKGSAFCMSGLKRFEPPAEADYPANTRADEGERIGMRFLIAASVLSFAGGAMGSLLCGLIINAF
ncbi:MAG: hypothetical protein ACI4L9_02030 [Candidatus Coproplasma sp.]